ncbi:hypothetical protein [Roseivirga sp.]|uniref:hypothetical protein n=1 Tax=Roseivirga sp. TaxID=1964215 RepID=UPI003B523A9E
MKKLKLQLILGLSIVSITSVRPAILASGTDQIRGNETEYLAKSPDNEDDSINCWMIGLATKELLKKYTDLPKEDIKKIRDLIIELCEILSTDTK